MRKLKLFFACLLMAVLSIGQVWGDKSTLTFTDEYKDSGATANDDVSWTVTSDGTESTYDATKGIHYGTSSAQVQYIRLSTNGITGTITQVKVNASTASGVSATVAVKVGTTDFTGGTPASATQSLTSSAANYTFTGSASGNILVEITKPSKAAKAIYCKSIEVTYSTGGSTTPTVSVSPTSLTFDSKEQGASAPGAKTFTITGSNLTGNLSMSASTSSDYYTWSVTSGSLTKNGSNAVSATVTVTPKSSITDEAGSKAGTITISGGGASSQTVSLSTTVTAPAHSYTYNKAFSSTTISDWSSWDNGYSTAHTVNFDIYNEHAGNDCHVYFAGASKQTTTITDKPVAKNGAVNLILDDPNKYISAIKFVGEQWGTKAQTMVLKYSTDGGDNWTAFAPAKEATNFVIEELNLPAKVNAVQVAGKNSSNQIGYASVHFDLVDKVNYSIGKSETGCTLSITNGTSAITSAEEGDEVYVSIASTETGYENAGFVVKDADNNTITVTAGKFTMPAKNVTITATATKKQYIVTLSATNGKIQVGGVDKESITVAHGETADLTAVANTNFAFSSWATSDGEKVVLSSTTDNPTTITVTGAATVTANFISSLKPDPGISWSEDSKTVVKGQSATLPSFNNPNSLAVTYSSTNESVAEIDNDGDVTINGVGSTIIKATYTETSQYAGKEVSYNLTVKGRVTWHVIKEGTDVTSYDDYAKDVVPTKPTGITSCDASISLVGWTTSTYAKSDDEPATLYTGNVPAVTDNADYYAVWAVVEEGGWNEITAVANLTAGTYAICSDNYFMKAEKLSSKNRLDNGAATPEISGGKLETAPVADCQWTISINANGKYLFSNGDNYAVATTTKNEMILSSAEGIANDAHAQWEIARTDGIFEVTNIGRAGDSDTPDNKYLRNNTTSGWACYSSTQGGAGYAPRFFKYSAGSTTGYTTNCVGPVTITAPTFDVAADTYYETKTVKISNHDANLVYFYTTDGNAPAADGELNPTGTSVTYNHATGIAINASCTLKAIAYDADGNYSDVTSVAYEINLPYDFADFVALTPKVNGKEYVVRGIISQKGTLTSDDQLPYWISADGSTTGQIKCHNGLGLNKATFSSADDVNLGDNVTVVGTWSTQYSNLNANNWMLEYTARVHKSYEIVGNLTTNTFDDGEAYDEAILANLSAKEVFTNNYEEAIAGVTFNCSSKTAWHEGETTLTVYAELAGTPLTSKDFGVTVTSASLVSIALKPDDAGYQTKTVYYLGEDFVAPTIVATLSDANTIEAVATYVSGFDNTQTGAQTIVVSYTRDAITEQTSYNITMKDYANDADHPYTVAEALDITQNVIGTTTSAKEIYVQGIVSKLGGNISSGKWGYYISADGTETSQFQIYNGYYLNGASFTNATKLQLGDEVIVKGKVVNYNGTKPQFADGLSQIYSLARTPNFEIEDVASFEVGTADLAEDDLNITTPSDGDITFVSGDAEVATIIGNAIHAVAPGTVTITANMAADGIYKAASTTFSVTVVAAEPAETCDGTDDFNDELSGETATSYKDRSTTNGWTATNAQWTTINTEKRYFTINGKTDSYGVITSPELSDGIASLKIRYANMNSEANGVSFKVEIKKGTNVEAEYTITKANSEVTQGTVYTETIENINVAGDFQIVITNLCPSNNGSNNKDRVSIGKLCWTGYTAPVYTEVRSGLEAGRHYTICLKKKIIAVKGATFWNLNKRDEGATVAYLEEASLPYEAGTPFIFQATNDNEGKLEVVYEGGDVENPVSNGALRGRFTDLNQAGIDAAATAEGSDIYMLKNNELRQANGRSGNTMGAYKAYIVYGDLTPVSTSPLPAPGKRVKSMPMEPQVTTDVENINASEQPVKMMIDGQLFILRGEKLYDATGRLVK